MAVEKNGNELDTLDAKAIAARIPHGDSMSLLDRVEKWDEHQILCSTRSHCRDGNPLVENAQLSSAALIEYGAQAAAIHSSLLQSDFDSGGPAFLGAIKSVQLLSESVPRENQLMLIQAKAEFYNSSGAIYNFVASIQGREIANGKLILAQPTRL